MRLLKALKDDERGGPLAEFALVIGFLFMVGIFVFEITRFFTQLAMAEYATHQAARRAVVRPPVCAGVPEVNQRDPGAGNPVARFGTLCSAGGQCVTPATAICTGVAGNAVVDEIFGLVRPLLPNGATPANLEFTYEPSVLGFLGGPYVPIVSVSLTDLEHDFIMPLGAFFTPWSGGAGGGNRNVPLPPLTATMPGEDLNLGTGG
jgi:hypothetical protein